MLTSGQQEPLDETSLSQKRKPYRPEYLHGDFGSDGPIAQEGVWTLYNVFLRTDNPKAQDFFCQWKILFGEVCGYDVEKLSDKLKKLAEFYGVKGKPEPGRFSSRFILTTPFSSSSLQPRLLVFTSHG